MLRTMIYLLLASGASLAILGLLLWRAPRGWQDQDGFHLGEEPYQQSDDEAADSAAEASVKAAASRRAA